MKQSVERTYKRVTQIEHVLMRPDMYVGPTTPADDSLWLLRTPRFLLQKIKYVPALYKIFDEVLVNAADNYQRDSKMTAIRVDLAPEQIAVWNDGRSIPVQLHRTHQMLVPELIFGHLLTSSNYEDGDGKTTGGRNGFGAKLTNIFSSRFAIEVADSVNRKLLKITWLSNMAQMTPPDLQDYEGPSYTKVIFTPDFKRFGVARLTPDMLSLLKRRVYDIAGIAKVKVYLNGSLVQVANFRDYVQLYLESPEDVIAEVERRKQSRWEVLVCRSEGQFMQVSFVNGICTSRGGTHINYILDQIVEKVSLALAKKKQLVKPFQIKAQLKLFVSCLIENPSFDSQTKETLTTPAAQFGSTCEISDEFVKQLLKSGIVERMLMDLRLKEHSKIDKELRKVKRNRLVIPKLDDANEAGRSNDCCLILTEGDSAKTLALCGIEELGRDYYGVYPLKGKLVNVKELTPKQVMENLELSNLVKIIGLSFETEYESTEPLRYGSVMIMADQDNDGSHIKGLIINFFETFWPSLCRLSGFLKEFITPIVKCRKGTASLSFYSQVDYRKWLETAEAGWTMKYYKGLGTSTAKEAKEYFSELSKHELVFDYRDNEDREALDLAFGKKNADLRKSWLSSYNPEVALDQTVKQVKVADFVHKELIHFSASDNVRSIPSAIDGLKPSQRKVLFSCFKRNLVSEIKVAQLAGYVAEHSAYHHGEMSLCSTIVGMAQNYIGSNNLNLLEPLGQFGTRYQNGKDAASARYIFTKLNKLTRYLFHEADDHVVDYITEENQMIEPKYYVPVLPLVLINGCEGIGTGWSTTIYSHRVEDVIQLVRKRIAGEPWEINIGWEHFRGAIIRDRKTYVVKGVFEREREKVVIREIPPTKSIRDYKEFLEQKLSSAENQHPELEDVKEYHHDSTIEFTVKFIEEKEPPLEELEKYLKLTATYQENNMHLFGQDGKIKRYDSITDILEDFYEERLLAYQKRKNYLLSKFERESQLISNQIRFIEANIRGEFRMIDKKQEWVTKLRAESFSTYQQINKVSSTKRREDSEEEQATSRDYNYLLQMPIWSFCAEKIEELSRSREELSAIIDYYQSTTIRDLWLKDIDEFEDAWTKSQSDHKIPSKKSITEQLSPKRKRQPLELVDEEPKNPRARRSSKINLMQEELEREPEAKDGRKLIKTDSLGMEKKGLKTNDEGVPMLKRGSSIDFLLSKYLSQEEKKEETSLSARIQARVASGDDTFNASYKAALSELERKELALAIENSLND